MSRRILILLLVAIVLVASPWPAAVPAVRADAEIVYLALGDSVPSGEGIGEDGGYPRRFGQRLADETGRSVRYWNRARSGEQSGGVLARQLEGLSEIGPDVVTLTVGANDFLIPAVECIATKIDPIPGDLCRMPDPRQAVAALESNLRQILERLAGETTATIVVTTYYNPFPRGGRCAPGLVDLAMGQLNASIAQVVREQPERAVLVDLLPLFRGHEGREPTGWFVANPIRLACTDIHPNADGQTAIANAVWGVLVRKLR